jgi:hypothetical protein
VTQYSQSEAPIPDRLKPEPLGFGQDGGQVVSKTTNTSLVYAALNEEDLQGQFYRHADGATQDMESMRVPIVDRVRSRGVHPRAVNQGSGRAARRQDSTVVRAPPAGACRPRTSAPAPVNWR